MLCFYSIVNAVSVLGLQWFVMQLDEEQADSADRADWMAGLGLWMPHLIYGCMKCRVRFFHRKNELPQGNNKKKKKSHGDCVSTCDDCRNQPADGGSFWLTLLLVDVRRCKAFCFSTSPVLLRSSFLFNYRMLVIKQV